MSPNVGNFVHDLVEMAKAMETLPQVQEALRQAEETRGKLVETINSIGADLEQSRNYAATLEQKVRTVEAERDDAEIRFLELDEKAAQVDAILRSIMVSAEHGKDLIVPPKPQPEPVQQPIPEVVQSIEPDWKQDQAETSLIKPRGQGEALPMTANSGETKSEQTSVISSATEDATLGTSPAPQPPASQDQSEINPSLASASGVQTEASVNVTASSTDNATSGSEPNPSGPYTGKRYVDVPGFVSYSDWIDGGGTYNSFWAGRT